MDPRLQAGLELQLEKQAQQEYDSSLSGVLGQYFKQAEETEVSEEAAQEAMATLAEYHNIEDGSDSLRWHYSGDDGGKDPDLWEYMAEDDPRVQAKKKSKSIDGDGDGYINDGTSEEKRAAASPGLTAGTGHHKQASVSSGQVMSTMLRGIAHN
jgi:hypothetical protein